MKFGFLILPHIFTLGLAEGKGNGMGEGAKTVDGEVEPGGGEGQDGSHGATVGYTHGGGLDDVVVDSVGVLFSGCRKLFTILLRYCWFCIEMFKKLINHSSLHFLSLFPKKI